MKKIVIVFFCVITLDAFADCELRIRVNDFKPQYYQNENGTWGGMSVELSELLFKEATCIPIYTKVPWKRSLSQLKTGRLDVMMNLSMTEKRNKFLYFIGPQRDESIVLVVRNNTEIEVRSLEDLKKFPKQIGFESGSYYGKDFELKLKSDEAFAKKFAPVSQSEQNVNKLRRGRISGFLGDTYSVSYRIKNDPLYRDFKILPFFVNRGWVYWGLSKKSVSKQLFDTLQKSYDSLKSGGAFERVLERYR